MVGGAEGRGPLGREEGRRRGGDVGPEQGGGGGRSRPEGRGKTSGQQEEGDAGKEPGGPPPPDLPPEPRLEGRPGAFGPPAVPQDLFDHGATPLSARNRSSFRRACITWFRAVLSATPSVRATAS